VHTDQWKDRPFVGRAREYRELYEAWEATQRCEPSHRLILGDSGIGKSTLVERVTTAAGLEGATVVRVQCHEAEREIPYAMVSGLISQLVARPGASATPPEALAELAQTIPEVRRRFPVLPAALESRGDAARIRFTEATHALVSAVAEEHPVILVVDDVHYSDDVSLAVLHRVIRLTQDQATQVLALARPGELHQSPRIAHFRDHGTALSIRSLVIDPLSREESSTLFNGLLRERQLEASPTIRRKLLSAAAGYPLVLELLIHDWARSGDRSLPLALSAITAELENASEPLGAYQLLLERLTTHLGPHTRAVLNVAAVLGPRLNEMSFYSVADINVGEAITGMTALCQLRLLRDAGAHLEFANDLIRGHAYSSIPVPARKALHHRIADVLLDRTNSGDESLDFELAWHLMRSGRADRARAFLFHGASTAIARGAVHEAEERLSSALAALVGPDLERASLLLAQLLQEQGRHPESQRVLSACPTAERTSLGQVLVRVAQIRTAITPEIEASRHAEFTADALENSTASGEDLLAALKLASLIAGCLQQRDLARRYHGILANPRFACWSGDARLELDLQRAYLAYVANLPSASNELLLDELLRLLAQSQRGTVANLHSIRLLLGIGLCYRRAARYSDALRYYELGLDASKKLEEVRSLASACTGIAIWHLEAGTISDQHYYAEQALRTDRFPSRNTELIAIHAAGLALALSGRAGKAIDMVRQPRLHSESMGAHLEQYWLLVRSDVLWLAGEHKGAILDARRAVTMADGRPLSRSAAGTLHKWLGLLLQNGERGLETLASSAILRHDETSDVWDEAQRLAGDAAISKFLGLSTCDITVKLQTVLARLHGNARLYLDNYGMMP
jgi:tetratricopeptide (TPR) repeat protein